MASTIFSYFLEAGRNSFPVSFEYLARRFVKVTLVGDTRLPLTLNVDYRFTSKMEIETTVNWAPGVYQTIEIRRVTSSTDRLVNFTDGSILRSQDLNISQIQAIHIAEEGRDIADSALIHDGIRWDAFGRPISNVGYPSLPGDATNVSYVLDQLGRTVRTGQGERINEIPLDRANKVLGFDANRQPIALIPSAGSSMDLELALADDINPLKGASKVGFYDPVAPAFLKTTSDILNMVPVSVLRVVPKELWGAIHDSTSTYGIAKGLNELIKVMNQRGGGSIELTYGRHMIESFVELLSNVHLSGIAGDNSVIRGMFPSPINRMVTTPAGVLQRNIKMSNFKLDRTAPNTQHGIITGGVLGLDLTGITVEGYGPGITSGAIGISAFNEFAEHRSYDVNTRHCKVIRPNNFGIAYGNVSRGQLSNNYFVDAWREAIGLECWGSTSVVEDISVEGNILHMNTRAGNHVGGTEGPAILVGGAGASYAGLTRRCTLSGNIITIVNEGNLPKYRGIVAVGGLNESVAVEDIDINHNTIYGAPSEAISVGAGGSISRRIFTTGNRMFNPSSGTVGEFAAIKYRYAQDCVSIGDIVIGDKHSYAVMEDDGSSRNIVTSIIPGKPTKGLFFRSSSSSVFSDATTNQVMGGHQFQEGKMVKSGETVKFSPRTNPNRGIYLIITTSGAYAILSVVGSAAPVVIAKSIDMVVGAIDNGQAQAFNIFPSSVTTLSVTNRVGGDHSVTMLSLNAS